MKKVILLAVVLMSVLSTVSFAQEAAAEPAVAAETVTDAELGIELDVTYVSKYIWRGFDRFANKGAVQPSVTLDLWNSGFSVNALASYAGASGAVDATEYNYTIAYDNMLNEGDASQIDYTVAWTYFDFIDQPSDAADMQEFSLVIAMPQICDFGVVPHYAVYYMWPAKSNATNSGMGGFIHALGFTYGIDAIEELPITFSWDIVYNDGTGLADGAVDSDWSHMVFGLAAPISFEEIPGKLTAGVYFQKSFEDTVNENDELWTGVSYTLSF